MAESETVDKLEAARRQLDTCIELHFHDRDTVSQHTLAMAAHTILFDLSRGKGIEGSLREPSVGSAEERLNAVRSFRVPQNFFKHADSDPGAQLRFSPGVTQLLIMDAARLYVLLTLEVTRHMKIFFLWFQLRYPNLFFFEPVEEELRSIRKQAKDAGALKAVARGLL